jgi:hypothetical protein
VHREAAFWVRQVARSELHEAGTIFRGYVILLAKTFLVFHVTRRFITVSTTACHWSLSEPHDSSPNIHSLFNINFNNTLASKARFTKWSLPIRLSDLDSVRTCHAYRTCYTLRPSFSLWFDTLIILGTENKLWSPWLCSFLQPPDTSSLLGQMLFSARRWLDL